MRKRHFEQGTLLEPAFDAHRSAVSFHDPADIAEPESKARRILLKTPGGPKVLVKNMREIPGGDSDPVVLDGNTQNPGGAGRFDPDLWGAPVIAERVVQEIIKYAAQVNLVGAQAGLGGAPDELDPPLPLFRFRPKALRCPFEQVMDIDLPEGQADFLLLQNGHLQNPLRLMAQPTAFFQNDLAIPGQPLRIRPDIPIILCTGMMDSQKLDKESAGRPLPWDKESTSQDKCTDKSYR